MKNYLNRGHILETLICNKFKYYEYNKFSSKNKNHFLVSK